MCPVMYVIPICSVLPQTRTPYYGNHIKYVMLHTCITAHTCFYSNLDLKGVLIGRHFEIFSCTVNNWRKCVKQGSIAAVSTSESLYKMCIYNNITIFNYDALPY